jgi:surface carbohydrate biosynthesis protein (TIGR04326 family)
MERLMRTKSNLLLWDLDTNYSDDMPHVINWNSYTNSPLEGIFSIPHLVEQNADYLKAKYLSLIYEFGEAKINSKRIIDHLTIRQNFSYWWMTLFVEKCNYAKSPQINNIIKLMALEQWLKENKYQKITLVSANKELAMSVSQLAKRLLIDFEWQKNQISKSHISAAKKVFHTVPNIIKSAIWLMHYLISNWALKGVGVKEWRKATGTTTFVSYLFNLVPESTKVGQYESRYWTKLTDLLDDNQHSTNWLHIYVEDSLLPSSKKARDLIKGFNCKKNGNQVHVTLASFLTVSLIFSTLKDWYKVFKFNKLVRKQIQQSSDYFWPLFIKDCQDSMAGIPAMSNLLYFNLFEKAMSELPIQSRGCYLQENQGWEFGFISAWRSAGHKNNLIGFPPSAVIYWDLRNFFDPRTYENKDSCSLPLPDFVGVNGEVSKNIYLDGGYPHQDLLEVESLRYLYLSNFSELQTKRKDDISKGKTVLVVGDYLRENTYKQLDVLSSALSDVEQPVRYIIKPHPACPVNMADFPNLFGELSTKPIQELLRMSDIVYSSLITSAAIDAYCAGLPVITLLGGKTLNMSPLRGSKSVYFVENSGDLSDAINTIEVTDWNQKGNYFYLDSGLPRWQKWLNDDFVKK